MFGNLVEIVTYSLLRIEENIYGRIINTDVKNDELLMPIIEHENTMEYITLSGGKFNISNSHSRMCINTNIINIVKKVSLSINRENLDKTNLDSYIRDVSLLIGDEIKSIDEYINNIFSHECNTDHFDLLSKFLFDNMLKIEEDCYSYIYQLCPSLIHLVKGSYDINFLTNLWRKKTMNEKYINLINGTKTKEFNEIDKDHSKICMLITIYNLMKNISIDRNKIDISTHANFSNSVSILLVQEITKLKEELKNVFFHTCEYGNILLCDPKENIFK